MCKMCEMRAVVELLKEEMEFRIYAFQQELRFGNPIKAADERNRGKDALDKIFSELETIPRLIAQIEAGEATCH